MPWEFEFNDKLLLVLAYANSSRHTVDYSFDNWLERERDFEVREKVWYEHTKSCNGCWKVRTKFKTQVSFHLCLLYLQMYAFGFVG